MSVNPTEVATAWLARYASALSSANVPETVSTFLPHGWLRDIQVFTWDNRSLSGHEKISSYLANTLPLARISNVLLDTRLHLEPEIISAPSGDGVFAAFTFETPIVHGRGAVRLFLDSNSEWKALTVYMTVSDLKGHEELSHESGIYEGHTAAWSDVLAERQQQTEADPNVLIGSSS